VTPPTRQPQAKAHAYSQGTKTRGEAMSLFQKVRCEQLHKRFLDECPGRRWGQKAC
jgi:hypothetical protein